MDGPSYPYSEWAYLFPLDDHIWTPASQFRTTAAIPYLYNTDANQGSGVTEIEAPPLPQLAWQSQVLQPQPLYPDADLRPNTNTQEPAHFRQKRPASSPPPPTSRRPAKRPRAAGRTPKETTTTAKKTKTKDTSFDCNDLANLLGCPRCHKFYKSDTQLEKHYARLHGGDPSGDLQAFFGDGARPESPLACRLCGRRFERLLGLVSHYRTKHKVERMTAVCAKVGIGAGGRHGREEEGQVVDDQKGRYSDRAADEVREEAASGYVDAVAISPWGYIDHRILNNEEEPSSGSFDLIDPALLSTASTTDTSEPASARFAPSPTRAETPTTSSSIPDILQDMHAVLYTGEGEALPVPLDPSPRPSQEPHVPEPMHIAEWEDSFMHDDNVGVVDPDFQDSISFLGQMPGLWNDVDEILAQAAEATHTFDTSQPQSSDMTATTPPAPDCPACRLTGHLPAAFALVHGSTAEGHACGRCGYVFATTDALGAHYEARRRREQLIWERTREPTDDGELGCEMVWGAAALCGYGQEGVGGRLVQSLEEILGPEAYARLA